MKHFLLLAPFCMASLFAEAPGQADGPEAVAEPPRSESLAAMIPRLKTEGINRSSLALLAERQDLASFVGGTYLLVNASEIEIAGKIGGQEFELKPGQQQLLQPKQTHPGGACQVTLSYQRDEQWQVFRNTRWSTKKSYRSLVFFHQSADHKRLKVSPIVDMLPPGAAKKAPRPEEKATRDEKSRDEKPGDGEKS